MNKTFKIINDEFGAVRESGYKIDTTDKAAYDECLFANGGHSNKLQNLIDELYDLDAATLCEDENGVLYAVRYTFVGEKFVPAVWQRVILIEKEKLKMKEKLTVKTYNSNATVYGAEKFLDIQYDGDYLACYCGDPYNNEDEAIAEYRDDITSEIKETFPDADDDNIEDIVLSIMIHASCIISAMWKE